MQLERFLELHYINYSSLPKKSENFTSQSFSLRSPLQNNSSFQCMYRRDPYATDKENTLLRIWNKV